MKITEIKTFLVNPTGRGRNWIFLKVYTDEGIEGIGEAFNTGKDRATESVIRSYIRWLKGKDPTKIIYHWQALYRSARFPLGTISMGALSGLELALWDITGKAYGQPVYKLLGGPCRDKILVYCDCSPKNALSIVKKGYSAIKFGPGRSIKDAVKRVRGVRNEVGDDVDICLDYHSVEFSPANAIRMAKALEPYNPFFLEEPVLHENIDAMAEVKAKTTIPIATGERIFTRYGFRELLEKRAVDIIQPDVIVCGGILETLRIAAMAEAYYVTLAPHNPFGPVAEAACIQVAACAPNFIILESVPRDPKSPRSEIVKEPIKFKDGYLEMPSKPGLGIELNEDALAKYPYSPYDRRTAINEDGSIGLV